MVEVVRDQQSVPRRTRRRWLRIFRVGFGFAAFESAGYALIPVPPSRYGTGR